MAWKGPDDGLHRGRAERWHAVESGWICRCVKPGLTLSEARKLLAPDGVVRWEPDRGSPVVLSVDDAVLSAWRRNEGRPRR